MRLPDCPSSYPAWSDRFPGHVTSVCPECSLWFPVQLETDVRPLSAWPAPLCTRCWAPWPRQDRPRLRKTTHKNTNTGLKTTCDLVNPKTESKRPQEERMWDSGRHRCNMCWYYNRRIKRCWCKTFCREIVSNGQSIIVTKSSSTSQGQVLQCKLK